MRPEEHMEICLQARADGPLIFVFPSDHRLASQAAVAPEKIVNETSIFRPKPLRGAPRRSGVFQNRAGIDLKPEYEVAQVVHAISNDHIDAPGLCSCRLTQSDICPAQ